MSQNLFSPFKFGRLTAPHRIAMAPMTRTRATAEGVPKPLVADYYAQRASAALIVTECTQISDQAHGIHCAPGIHTPAQVTAWERVVAAVHRQGGRIYLQLWHCGRTGHSSIRGGVLPVAPSAIAAAGKAKTPAGLMDYETPRALDLDEIPAIVEDFRRGAQNALEAGFDGVELHGAFGYLVDEFLQDASNRRTDRYGGSPANRCRFAIEVMQALAGVWGADRVGMRISPSTRVNGMDDGDPHATFGHLVRELDGMKVGYLHVMEPNDADLKTGTVKIRETTRTFRPLFGQAIITNVGYTRDSGEVAVAAGVADLVAYGKPFIANPDLPLRFERGAALNPPDFATFYGSDERGYTDYPFLDYSHGASPAKTAGA